MRHPDDDLQRMRQREWARQWRSKNREAYNDTRRSQRLGIVDEAEGAAATAVHRAMAAYDPLRDGLMVQFDLTAMLMGDPPVGRRAIDDAGRKTVTINQQALSPQSEHTSEGTRAFNIQGLE